MRRLRTERQPFWVKTAGEYRTTRLQGEKVDILGKGGFGIAPPSINPLKGTYEFIQGGLPDLDHLPKIRPGSLPDCVYRRGAKNECPVQSPYSGPITDGHRNDFLFLEARRLALRCPSFNDLLLQLHDINKRECDPAETAGVIAAKARYVWSLKEEGRCFAPGTKFAAIRLDQAQLLYQYPPALTLWHFLKCSHAPDHKFAVSPGGLSTVLPQSARTITKARDFLLNLEYLICTHKGGRGEGDADRFRFGRS